MTTLGDLTVCFMCFWFCLEILRLVYKKKNFLKYWSVSILFDLLSSEKNSIAPWKKILQNWAYMVSKEAEFCIDFKNVQKSRGWQKGKQIFIEKLNFRDLENLAKNCFSEKKTFGNFLTKKFYTFFKSTQNSAFFDTLRAQFWRNFFSTLIRDAAGFFLSLKVKKDRNRSILILFL